MYEADAVERAAARLAPLIAAGHGEAGNAAGYRLAARQYAAAALLAAEDVEEPAEDLRAIQVRVRLLCNRSLWMTYCEETGTNEWAVNEGQLDMDDYVWMSEGVARRIGLLS